MDHQTTHQEDTVMIPTYQQMAEIDARGKAHQGPGEQITPDQFREALVAAGVPHHFWPAPYGPGSQPEVTVYGDGYIMTYRVDSERGGVVEGGPVMHADYHGPAWYPTLTDAVAAAAYAARP